MKSHPAGAARRLLLNVTLIAAAWSAIGGNTVAAASSPSAVPGCLPIEIPTADVLFSSPRKVFAHYFYPFPLSVDNAPASQDYYNRQYLNPQGESGKWQAKGGYLRQRPLATQRGVAANWKLFDMEREVRLAMARGITGFAVDAMSADQGSNPSSQLHNMLAAAQAVDSRFKIMVMPDIAALHGNAAAVEDIIRGVAKSPSAYRLSDGRLVISAFNAGANPADWWQGIFNDLKSSGIQVAFLPVFLGWSKSADSFAPISIGLGDWGTATADSAAAMQDGPTRAHGSYSLGFIAPVDPQQYRPKSDIYWESSNSGAFRAAWMSAINGQADWVQLVTWNDFSESSEVEPYTDASLAGNVGTGFYDLTGYYATWYLTGKQPTPERDTLYFFYRDEPTTAPSPAQQNPTSVRSSTPEDSVELVAFLTAPGTLAISISGHDYTQDAPAGITVMKAPSQAGIPSFKLLRDGKEVFSVKGTKPINGAEGLPSGTRDLTYWSGSGTRDGVCQLNIP